MTQQEILSSINVDFAPRIYPDKYKNRLPNLWRYREAIPILSDANIVSFQEGFTPLLPINIAGKIILIKQDHLFPSGSYKDRGATVLISHAKENSVKHCVQDSSGNAGCAIAAYAAKAKITCDIYVPATTSAAKLKQIEAYGARLIKINGTREDTAKAALQAAQNIFYASHCYNNYFYQGTKTFAYEVCEQLNWKAPDCVVLPAGNGTLILGCYIGFVELINAGVISKMPKLIAVQTVNCAPLAYTFENNLTSIADVRTETTIAEGIAIKTPHRGSQIIEIVRATGGTFICVSESEIKVALTETTNSGFYIEPTSAATIAGLKKYISGYEDETVVSVFTGNGLKK